MSDTPKPLDPVDTLDTDPPEGGPPPDDRLPGMKLGDYVVQKAVAWGGMGIVYSAVHPLIGRKVAVKVLRPNYAADPEQTGRFLMEAKAISAIKHRGIIDIISFGNLDDGRQYMVMEFLEGEPLEAVMQREGPMGAARALGIVEEIVDALSAAHSVGVVHRDLKPSNVYLTEQSNGSRYVKLVDFGLARRAPLEELDRVGEKASLMAGTPEYLSPEQVKGLAATPRTDLYCLGVLLFEMVTGQLPFEGSMLELLNAHLNKVPRRAKALVPELPVAVEELIAQLLEKAPGDRPSSAAEVRQRVQRVLRQLKEESTHIGPTPSGPRRGPPPADEVTLKRETDRTAEPAPPPTDRVAPVERPTQRTPSRVPVWAWPIALLALLALGGVGAGLRVLITPGPPVVVAHPVPARVVPPAPPPKVEAPRAPDPDVVELPSPTVTPVIKPKPKPPPPGPRVGPLTAPHEERDFTVCRADNWNQQLTEELRRADQDFSKLEAPDDSPGWKTLDALRRRFKSGADCLTVARGLAQWRETNLK